MGPSCHSDPGPTSSAIARPLVAKSAIFIQQKSLMWPLPTRHHVAPFADSKSFIRPARVFMFDQYESQLSILNKGLIFISICSHLYHCNMLQNTFMQRGGMS